MSCSTKSSPPAILAACGSAYATEAVWNHSGNVSSSSEPEHEVFEIEDPDTVYPDDFIGSDEHILDVESAPQDGPPSTVLVISAQPPKVLSSSSVHPNSDRPPHADDITQSLLAAECCRLTLLIQAQPDCAVLPLIQEAQWCWPPKEEVHGDRATIACADDIERCRLCIQHALGRSLPAVIREKYTRHDHAYCEYEHDHSETSIVESLVQDLIERKYADSLAKLWQRSTVKSNLFPNHTPQTLLKEPLTETVEDLAFQIEDMETTHSSVTAKFEEVEVPANASTDEDSSENVVRSAGTLNPPTSRTVAEHPTEVVAGKTETTEDDEGVLFVVKTTTTTTTAAGGGKPGKSSKKDIVVRKHFVFKTNKYKCLDPNANTSSCDLKGPEAFGTDSQFAETVAGGNLRRRQSTMDEDQDENDIWQTCVEVLNDIVQTTHDQTDEAGKIKSSIVDTSTTKMQPVTDSRAGTAAPAGRQARHVSDVSERRTTRGLKIDFVKLDTYGVASNERVDSNESSWRPTDASHSTNAHKGVTCGRKRKGRAPRTSVPSKWTRRDTVEDAVDSDADDLGDCISEAYTSEAANFFSQHADFRPEMIEEVVERTACVCVSCDPKMKRLRLQENYLSESDFFKVARFVSRLSTLQDEGIDDQQDASSTNSSVSSDDESVSSPSPVPESSSRSGPEAGIIATRSRFAPKDTARMQCHDCLFCGHKYTSADDLQRHLPVHEFRGGKGPISSRCSVCDIVFRDIRVMNGVLYHMPGEHHSTRRDQHERRHRPNALNCVYPQCRNYVFGSRQRLAVHMELHRQSVVIGGVEHWESQERKDTLKDQLGQPHVSCEFCLAEFNWRTRTAGISTHVERFTRHRERHMHYEMLGEPWHCAIEGCQRSFPEQADLEEHMWLMHAVNCYCVTCDWIVWGDSSDVQVHRKNCKAFLPTSGGSESLAKKDPVLVVNSNNKVFVKAIKGLNLNGDSKAPQQTTFILRSNLPRATTNNAQASSGEGRPPPAALASKAFHQAGAAVIEAPAVRPRGRPKLLKNFFPKVSVVRDSHSAASAVHLMNFSFYCEFCGAPFRRHHAKQHQSHVESHMPDRELTCVIERCGRKFEKREELQAHVKTKLSTCRYCGCVLFEGYKKHISACRILHEMEKQRSHREKIAEVDQTPGSQRRGDLRWGDNGQLLAANGALKPDEAQMEFLRNVGLAKGSVETIREKERIREKLRSQTYVANGKGRRSCTLSVSCAHCGLVFRNSFNLKQHRREYHEDVTNR